MRTESRCGITPKQKARKLRFLKLAVPEAKDLQQQSDDLDQQMDDYTKQLTTQYTALDTMMTKLAGTSSFLQQQFDSLTASK